MCRLVVASLTFALMLGPAVAHAADEEAAATVAFAPAGNLAEPRTEHTATLLPDGRVLVVGGAAFDDPRSISSAEVWDPETETFSPASPLTLGREGHTATLLPDGRILVIGGTCCPRNATVVEIWDPETETFTEAAPLVQGRIQGAHTATLLSDGRVLVIGGYGLRSRRLAAAEVWGPTTETFSKVGRMLQGRVGHSATLLDDGRVLVIGGRPRNDRRFLASAEVWDPATETFSKAGRMSKGREGHSATLLSDGRILVTGGSGAGNVVLARSEVWDPKTRSFSPAGDLAQARGGHTATLLPDGRVLVIGGGSGVLGISALQSAEAWDAATASFYPAGSLTKERWTHTATLLPDGRVLVIGGNYDGLVLGSAEVWDPTAGSTAPGTSPVPAKE